jgi:hypothetical protein
VLGGGEEEGGVGGHDGAPERGLCGEYNNFSTKTRRPRRRTKKICHGDTEARRKK